MKQSVGVALAVCIALSGCGGKKRIHPATPVLLGATETGVASWYGHPYHGRRAANGEIYDMEKMTAAHRTLPFNTWVRVYDLDNDKTTEVRIIDRGPFVEGRIIDLSHAAAQEIAMIGPGVARVRIEVIRTPPGVTPGLFGIQVGAFRVKANAEGLRARMEAQYGTARLVQRPEDRGLWRVLVGSETSEAAATTLAERIRKDSVEKSAGFVVRIDSN
jgi:rare lipoprotein A